MTKPVVTVLWGYHHEIAKSVCEQLNEIFPEYVFKRNVSNRSEVGPLYDAMTQKLFRESFSVLILYDPQQTDKNLKVVRGEIASIKREGRLIPRYLAPKHWPIPSSPETGADPHVSAPHVHIFRDILNLRNDKEKLDELLQDLQADLSRHRSREAVFDAETVRQQVERLANLIENKEVPEEHAKLGLMQAVLLPGVTDFSELRSAPEDGYVSRELLQRDITYLKTLHSLHGRAGDELRESHYHSKNISAATRNRQESINALIKARNSIGWDPDLYDGNSDLQRLWNQTIEADLSKLYEVVTMFMSLGQTYHDSPKDLILFINYSLSGKIASVDLNLIKSSNAIALDLQRTAGQQGNNHQIVFGIDEALLGRLGLALNNDFVRDLFENAVCLQANLVLLAHFLSLMVLKHDRCDIDDFDLAREINRIQATFAKTIPQIVNSSNNLIWLYIDSSRLSK